MVLPGLVGIARAGAAQHRVGAGQLYGSLILHSSQLYHVVVVKNRSMCSLSRLLKQTLDLVLYVQ